MLMALDYLDEKYAGVKGYLLTIGLSDEIINRLRAKLLA